MISTSDLYEPGCKIENGTTYFQLLFPGIKAAECLLFDSFEDSSPLPIKMNSENGERWICSVERDCTGMWYQYRVEYKKGQQPDSPYSMLPFADPYSKHVTVRHHYRQEAKTLIIDDSYDWEGDSHVRVRDPRDLIIYETHIKDLVANSSGSGNVNSVYSKWLDPDHPGGINHLKRLGINAVEFLPLQKFPVPEPPYGKETVEGFYNTWNPYSRNYWGYMTSFFMAPETSYASEVPLKKDDILGESPDAGRAIKNIIKLLHKNNIAVILDVVFNHTSIFDINPLGHHMSDFALRKDPQNKWLNRSGTGNEINTEHPVVRKLIADTIRYWTEEYHIDGFRFDLAGLIDEKSWDTIHSVAKSVNPDALLIAEPWGGRYVPYLFSNHGWSSWNDRFRNGIKGSDPLHDRGFIFSDWHNGADRKQLENWIRGTLRSGEGGLFTTSEHSVNYLESHDGYTLGDFIRITTRYDGENPVIEERTEHLKFSAEELRIAKLGVFTLMVSSGIAMIHSGQEFGRSKIIATETGVEDPESGRMDYNSYNKDNATNWINFEDLEINRDLFYFYRSMIQLRRESPGLRKSPPDSIVFDHYGDPLQICFYINGSDSRDIYDYYIAINATRSDTLSISIPRGYWEILVRDGLASARPIEIMAGNIEVQPQSAMLMRKLRH